VRRKKYTLCGKKKGGNTKEFFGKKRGKQGNLSKQVEVYNKRERELGPWPRESLKRFYIEKHSLAWGIG